MRTRTSTSTIRAAAALGAAVPTALAALAPTALAAPAAPVGDTDEVSGITSFAYSVSPAKVAPGGKVTVTASECEKVEVTVTAPVFDTLTVKDGHPGHAQVYGDAKPGARYEVVFDCDGEKGRATLTIEAGSTHPSPRPSPGHGDKTPGGKEWPAEDVKPGGGVKAGTGGSLSDLGPARLAAGGTVIAGAVVAGAVLLRRRPGRRV
ncbi:hypothetical protein [Streptomyces sp. NPDC005805]|uniref:hypothetical protein n=1 Tax=Streptomyces sp. NPDC005805 TaxID=3157068 RepID=UPI0033BFF79E